MLVTDRVEVRCVAPSDWLLRNQAERLFYGRNRSEAEEQTLVIPACSGVNKVSGSGLGPSLSGFRLQVVLVRLEAGEVSVPVWGEGGGLQGLIPSLCRWN